MSHFKFWIWSKSSYHWPVYSVLYAICYDAKLNHVYTHILQFENKCCVFNISARYIILCQNILILQHFVRVSILHIGSVEEDIFLFMFWYAHIELKLWQKHFTSIFCSQYVSDCSLHHSNGLLFNFFYAIFTDFTLRSSQVRNVLTFSSDCSEWEFYLSSCDILR